MKVFILAVVIALLCMVIKQYKPEYALVCQLCGVAVVFLYIASSLEGVLGTLREMVSSSGLDVSFLGILIKALAISVLTDLASSVCRDSGNNTLANAVELCGRTVIIVLSLPILKKLAEAAIGFIN